MRPYPAGSRSSVVRIVACAARAACSAASPATCSAVTSGWSPERIDDGPGLDRVPRGEHRCARPLAVDLLGDFHALRQPARHPVPGTGDADHPRRRRPPARRRSPTRPSACRRCGEGPWGVSDRIRVPRPAAMIRTVNGSAMESTRVAGAGPARLCWTPPCGEWSNGKTPAFGAVQSRFESGLPSQRSFAPRGTRPASVPFSCAGPPGGTIPALASPSVRARGARGRRSSPRRGRSAPSPARGGSGLCGGG